MYHHEPIAKFGKRRVVECDKCHFMVLIDYGLPADWEMDSTTNKTYCPGCANESEKKNG